MYNLELQLSSTLVQEEGSTQSSLVKKRAGYHLSISTKQGPLHFDSRDRVHSMGLSNVGS